MPMLKSKQKRRSTSRPFEIKVNLEDDRVSYVSIGTISYLKQIGLSSTRYKIYKRGEVAKEMTENTIKQEKTKANLKKVGNLLISKPAF